MLSNLLSSESLTKVKKSHLGVFRAAIYFWAHNGTLPGVGTVNSQFILMLNLLITLKLLFIKNLELNWFIADIQKEIKRYLFLHFYSNVVLKIHWIQMSGRTAALVFLLSSLLYVTKNINSPMSLPTCHVTLNRMCYPIRLQRIFAVGVMAYRANKHTLWIYSDTLCYKS